MTTNTVTLATIAIVFTVTAQLTAANTAPTNAVEVAVENGILPPPMAIKTNAPAKSVPGETMFVDDGEKQFTLFLPESSNVKASAEIPLTIHLNGEMGLVLSEHAKHGLSTPLIVVSWGTGVETYRGPFKDGTRFPRWLKLAADKLKEKGAPENLRFKAIDISAYGGGYGAVREILKSEDNVKLIRRLVLCDALYGSYEKINGTVVHKLSAEHLDPWLPIARAAVKGEKTFVFAYSQVPTTGYASCSECAAAVAEAVGATVEPVELDSCPAANDESFPLLYRADLGHFHEWGYDGVSDEAHIIHLKHLGDIWKVLDDAGAP